MKFKLNRNVKLSKTFIILEGLEYALNNFVFLLYKRRLNSVSQFVEKFQEFKSFYKISLLHLFNIETKQTILYADLAFLQHGVETMLQLRNFTSLNFQILQPCYVSMLH